MNQAPDSDRIARQILNQMLFDRLTARLRYINPDRIPFAQ